MYLKPIQKPSNLFVKWLLFLYQELSVNMHIPSEILKRHNTLKIRANATSSFFKLIREVCLILSMTTPVEHSPAQPTECTPTPAPGADFSCAFFH